MAKEAAKKKGDEEEEEKDEKEEKGAKKGKADDDEEGAEGDGGEGGEGEAAPKKSKKKLIIIAVIALVVLAAAGGAAWFFLFNKHEDKAAESGASGGEAAKAVYYTLPEFLVNLNTGGKQSSFLKMTVVLELAKQSDTITVEANLPKLFDTLNTYLRELRASDLAGSAGIQRLREELLLRANQTLAPTKVTDVLFKEIVVQ